MAFSAGPCCCTSATILIVSCSISCLSFYDRCMARLNNIIKFATLNLSIYVALIGLFLIGFALYVLFAQWGAIESGLFNGIGVSILLFGLCIVIATYIGFQGIVYQKNLDGMKPLQHEFCHCHSVIPHNEYMCVRDIGYVNTGLWTGRRILSMYQVFAILAFIGSIYILLMSTGEVGSMETARSSVESGSPLPYDYFEATLAEKFNNMFFAATQACKNNQLEWFWRVVGHRCPASMNEDSCRTCIDGRVQQCSANQMACLTQPGVTACPYDICRVGILSFLLERIV